MERIQRHDPSENAAILRLLLAVAVSIALHCAAAWFLPGVVSSDRDSMLPTHIVAPLTQSSDTPSRPLSLSELVFMTAIDSTRRQSGLASVETVDPTYYPAEELDVFPALRRPFGASVRPANGYVRVLVRIDASGRVTATRIFDSKAGGSDDTAAMSAVSRALFAPARKAGRNVRSEVVIEIR